LHAARAGIRERLQEIGYAGGKTIMDDYLREIRPIVSPPRTFQRTVYRPVGYASSICGSPATRSHARVAPDAGTGWC
jgi:hypothetical protein